MAGVIAATDNALGYWYPPSNKNIAGIVGVERQISSGLQTILPAMQII
jgi:phage tail sheath protein FI